MFGLLQTGCNNGLDCASFAWGVVRSQYTLSMAIASMASKEVLSAHVPNGQNCLSLHILSGRVSSVWRDDSKHWTGRAWLWILVLSSQSCDLISSLNRGSDARLCGGCSVSVYVVSSTWQGKDLLLVWPFDCGIILPTHQVKKIRALASFLFAFFLLLVR